MLRRTQSSQAKRKFYHEEDHKKFSPIINLTRPPTANAYSGFKHLRTSNSYQEQVLFNVEIGKSVFNATEPKSVTKLAKSVEHCILQLKMLAKEQAENERKKIEEILLKINNKVLQMESEISILTQELKQTKEMPKQTIMIEKKIMRRKAKESKGEMELLLEKVRLQQLSESLEEQISKVVTHAESPLIKTVVEEQNETESLRLKNRIKYLEMRLEYYEEREIERDEIISSLTSQIKMLSERLENVKNKEILIEEEMKVWREKAMMGVEDTYSHHSRMGYILFSLKKLRDSNRLLVNKLIAHEDVSSRRFEFNSNFQYELDFFKCQRIIPQSCKLLECRKTLENFEKENHPGTEGLTELGSLRYSLPTFFSLIEENYEEVGAWGSKDGGVSRIFVQVMRSLMISRGNDFLHNESSVRFPDFVFGWFEEFYFNSEKREICGLELYMQKPYPQASFYRDLMNKKLDQSWEVITFREFLIEELNLEELHFYVACQNLLFRRAGITRDIQLKGDFLLLVDFSSVQAVLDLLLADFEGWNLVFLSGKLREKVIMRGHTECVDSAFFLRCLLEYYRVERLNRLKYLKKLCAEFSFEKGLRFTSFLSILNRFAELPAHEKVSLYRECYCSSKGKITPEIIFTVASDKLIFLKYLRLKTFYSLPLLTCKKKTVFKSIPAKNETHSILESKTSSIICLQPSFPYLYSVYTGLISILLNNSHFTEKLESVGIASLIQQMNTLKRIIGDKALNEDSSVLKGKHFLHFLSDALSIVRTVTFQSLYELLEEQYKAKTHTNFNLEVDEQMLCESIAEEAQACFRSYKEVKKYTLWKNSVYQFRLNNAARKIQRMVRKKFILPFLELYQIIYTQVAGEH